MELIDSTIHILKKIDKNYKKAVNELLAKDFHDWCHEHGLYNDQHALQKYMSERGVGYAKI